MFYVNGELSWFWTVLFWVVLALVSYVAVGWRIACPALVDPELRGWPWRKWSSFLVILLAWPVVLLTCWVWEKRDQRKQQQWLRDVYGKGGRDARE